MPRTVAEALDRMQYHDAGAFVADIRLIFDNARKYNPPKHPIHVAAVKLSKVRLSFSRKQAETGSTLLQSVVFRPRSVGFLRCLVETGLEEWFSHRK